ncbi:MAG: dienelactone hydrolase family protein [Proteobacteria bacterium]|nr:dienelactone hydrolase family protein [Pseudomonadota bacterium]MBI3498435.1 dienelactone hydrolase family protein [Pseudomonadota bacterium]
MRTVAGLLIALALPALSGWSAEAETYVRQELRIQMDAAGSAGLETVLVRLDEPGRHPLALINHGSPRSASERPGMTALSLVPQAMEFARRGWAAAIVMRRGYASSGGAWAEDYGGCRSPDYQQAGRIAAGDLKAAIAHLASLPEIDGERIISVGVSAGGYATVALTADPPPGLKAAISFAGGRGSLAADEVCRADLQAQAFGSFGERSRVPMLWVYAENDHFFGPAVATAFKDAFVSAGGLVEFVKPPAFGEDGHRLFSAAGIAQWTPLVDQFLKAHGLVWRASPASLPHLAPPAYLSASAKAAFETYAAAAPHKAFAAAQAGGYGWRSGQKSEEAARAEALATCLRPDPARKCAVIAVDDAAE